MIAELLIALYVFVLAVFVGFEEPAIAALNDQQFNFVG